MSVLLGHASIDERGKAYGGQAGDQTGKEVFIQPWYSSGWNIVLRPKNTEVAEKMAIACETLCKENMVGYDQYQRNTLWDELEKVGWNPSALKTKCETDCSAFMTACARVAGINIPRVALGGGQYNAPVTQTMRNAFSSTGYFDVLTDSKYCTSDKYVKRGDILVRESGHTAMVLSNGESSGTPTTSVGTNVPQPTVSSNVSTVTATGVAHAFDKSRAGTYTVVENNGTGLRNAPEANSYNYVNLPKGTRVQNYGYYDICSDEEWLYIQVVYAGVTYTGFCAAKHLSK